MWIGGLAANLALQFAITGSVNRCEWGAGGSQHLWVGDATGGAENAQELIALVAYTAEHTKLLEDHSPRYNGENQKQREHAARDPPGIGQNAP